MAYETITVDVDNHIALVTLNRPDAMNALNDQLMTELADALKSAQENEKVRCIVITGSEKAFAAGADIAMMRDKSFVDVFAGDLFTPDTAAMMGLRTRMIWSVSGVKRSPAKTSTKLLSRIMAISAPAAKAFSEPVITMQRTFSFS